MKILHFIYGLSLGGAESFIRSCMLALANEDIEWHFALQNPQVTNQFFTQNVHSDNIYLLPPFTRNPIGQYRALATLIKKGNFDTVHIHANALINPIPILCCIKQGQNFIIHSHSTSTTPNCICRILHGVNKMWLRRNNSATRVACSVGAGRWMFGDRHFVVINNAIDISSFIFDKHARDFIRKKYGINDDAYLIGTVGRMVEAKNYPFIISLFREFLKIDASARLLLVGDGPLRDVIERDASDLGNSVIFAGSKQDTAPFYSAMHCFIAPSLFEGLSIVTVEAQASGVNIVVSDAIPDEVNVSGFVKKLSLSEPIKKWLDLLQQPKLDDNERTDRGLKLRNCRFDLPYLAETLKSLYMK